MPNIRVGSELLAGRMHRVTACSASPSPFPTHRLSQSRFRCIMDGTSRLHSTALAAAERVATRHGIPHQVMIPSATGKRCCSTEAAQVISFSDKSCVAESRNRIAFRARFKYAMVIPISSTSSSLKARQFCARRADGWPVSPLPVRFVAKDLHRELIDQT